MTDYMIPSYAKSFNLGHRALLNFFAGDNEIWRVEEKVDGSQVSVVKREGRLYFRSKGRAFTEENPDDMFKPFVNACLERYSLLADEVIYRGEFLKKPKHGCLSYSRIPFGGVVIFDIEDSDGALFSNSDIDREASRIGFEPVRLLMELSSAEVPPSLDLLKSLLSNASALGGSNIEGVVIKRTIDLQFDSQLGKLMIAKYVSEAFKEDQRKDWKESNPSKSDVVARIVDQYISKARLVKCIQRLQESGEHEQSLRDIGKLMALFPSDLLEDHREDIKEALFKYAWPHIKRGVTRPIPQMYKDWLVENQETPGT